METKTCEICGIIQTQQFMVEVPGDTPGIYRCSECLAPDYIKCEYCNHIVPIDQCDNVVNQTEHVCEACIANHYYLCEGCNIYFRRRNIHQVDNYGYYCGDCESKTFHRCDFCERIVLADNITLHNGDSLCETCYTNTLDEDETPDNNNLYDYSYAPDYKFYGKNKDCLYFGIELEIENTNDSEYLRDINDNSTILFAKADGSIDYGLEVVSHPMTFEYFNQHFKIWDNILKCQKHGYQSYNTDTCGIHIHISKKAFSTLHLYKFMKFFFENQEFIYRISQRSTSKLKQWADISTTGEKMVYKAKHKNGNVNRYTAINLQPHNTIEIRIFKGTLKQSSFRKNMEFLHALFYFTKTYGTSDMTRGKFLIYVRENSKQYKNLYTFWNNRENNVKTV